MILRDYQEQCLDAVFERLREHASTLIVLATGCGKTVIFSHVADRWPDGRVLVLAHRDELIRQAAEKLHAVTGREPAIEMGDERSDERRPSRYLVSSVQTMCRPKRQARFRPDDFGLVIVDEAHHAVARSYRLVIDHFRQNPDCRLLGVTATPKRSDELAMGQVFESVAFDFGIEPAIEQGWLVPVRQQAVVVEGLDFSSVKSVAGDLSADELDAIIAQEKVLHQMAAPTVEIVGDLPTLVFCVSVNHAKLMAEVLNRYKPQSALSLDGSTPTDERRQVVERFKSGSLQFLCNCGLFLEGFDAPNTAAVVMGRPTKSLALYTQVLGRGTRPLPGIVDGVAMPDARREAIAESGKPSMLVLDFVGNSGRHKIVSAADMLGGKYAEPVRQYARQIATDREADAVPQDVAADLEQASDELAVLEMWKEMRRREMVRARAEYQARQVSPFAGGGPAYTQAVDDAPRGDPPTDKQVWYLVKRLGWASDAARRLTKRQASAVIGKAKGE